MTEDRGRYPQLLRWAYEGEVAGETILRAFHDRGTFPEHGEELDTLVALERATAALLKPVVDREGLVQTIDGTSDGGLDASSVATVVDWEGFLRWTRIVAVEAMPKFQELVAVAPASSVGVLQLVLRHEEALLEFADRSLRGDVEAIGLIVAHLVQIARFHEGDG